MISNRIWVVVLSFLTLGGKAGAQSINKLEKTAINRTHIRTLHGDTVEVFDITSQRPGAKSRRLYYWYAQDQVNHSTGAYQGKLLHGPYQLLSRDQLLLVSGAFDKGAKTGRWRTYRSDGSLATSSEWHNGERYGVTVYYAVNGKPQRQPPVAARPAPAADTSGSRLHKLNPLRRKSKKALTSVTSTQHIPKEKGPKKKRPAAPAATGSSTPAAAH